MPGMSVVRIRAGASPGNDRYGNPIPGADVDTELTGVGFDPGGSREPTEVGRTAVITTPKLYFPSSTPDLLPTDRVRVFGVTYTIQGKPAVWVSLYTGETAGTVVELERVDG
jgi:hypothetical protein